MAVAVPALTVEEIRVRYQDVHASGWCIERDGTRMMYPTLEAALDGVGERRVQELRLESQPLSSYCYGSAFPEVISGPVIGTIRVEDSAELHPVWIARWSPSDPEVLDISPDDWRFYTLGNWGYQANPAATQNAREEMDRLVEAARLAAKEHSDAVERSRELLFSLLTREQQNEMKIFDTITLEAKGKWFRIETDSLNYNVCHEGHNYCLTLAGNNVYPAYDIYIAQLLWLKANPERFLQVANRH